MKPLTLDIENFFSIKKASLKLSGQGMVLVLGENHDAPKSNSNGSGKSSLLEALCWCCWGETICGLSGDEVVNERVGKNCRVVFTFEDEGKTYVVTRTRLLSDKGKKPNDLTFTVDGEDATKESMKATQKVVTEALGVDFHTFRAMMPGAGLKAASMTDKEVKLLLEDLLQASVLSQAQELAREEAKRLKADLEATTKSMEDAERQRKAAASRLTEYEVKHGSFEDDRDAEIMAVQKEVAGEMEVIDKAMEVAKRWKKASERILQLKPQEDSTVEQVATNRQVITQLRKNAQDALRALEIEQGLANAIRVQTEQAYTKYEKVGGTCPHCKQEVDETHKQKHLADLKAIIAEHTLKEEAWKQSVNAAKESWNRRIEEAQEKLKKAEEAMAEVRTEIRQLESIETEYEVAKSKHSTAKKRIKQLSEKNDELRTRVSPFRDLIAGEERAVAQLEGSVQQYRNMIKVTSDEKALYDFWVDGFSPAGLRSYMLEHVTPILNAKAQQYADILSDGEMSVVFHTKSETAGGESREKFNIEVKQRHGCSNYNGNSKGEKAKADLVICMAIGDLASLRANKVIPFRFLDEPFESVDSSGTEAITALLNSQREQYDTVYVITHNDYFKELFDKRITVVKKNGESTVETHAKEEQDNGESGAGDQVGKSD